MNILIIPARGGSKRIPRKNIKQFKGTPIIARTIKAVKKLNFFEKIIVSTDDKEIASVASSSGAEIPFIRPDNLSDDFTNTRDVILHALEWYASNSIQFDKVCCLYPTGVLINPYFGVKYKEILSGIFFNIILNISLLILIINIIDKRKQLNKTYFLTINSIIFISIPQIVFQIFINLINLKILLT